ncbi:unnamed protein product [Leptosia nina]|uniref:E3 ubiquitin-protein ligase n=1 Tax=Leptosia nina TaxID=320188 RepID=A0AAV1JYX9_9NEOP
MSNSDTKYSLFYEILAGVWVRNGLQIKGQAMTYIQANFCNSMVDMDIYWLQICAAHLPPNDFVRMCIDTFGVREWLSMTPMSASQAAEQDAMVEGLLTFLAILVSSRTNLGNDEVLQSRVEVATLLAAGDKTHSQLLELMPERSGNAHTRNFEAVLSELSVYRAPPKGSESLEQGLFVPKPVVWERYYDPLHVLRRAVHRRDFHASMDRFTAYVAEKRKAEDGSSNATTNTGNLWPPLRPAVPPPDVELSGDPRQICASGVLQAAILAVLHRGVRRRDLCCGGVAAPPDHVLALAVYLLDAAADLQRDRSRADSSVCVLGGSGLSRRGTAGVPMLCVFDTDEITTNACTLIAHVPPVYYSEFDYPEPYYSDSDPEWENNDMGQHAGPGPHIKPHSLQRGSTALAVPQPMQMVRNNSVPDDQSDAGGDAPELRALEGGESGALVVQDMGLAVQDRDLVVQNVGATSADMQSDAGASSVEGGQDMTLALTGSDTGPRYGYDVSELEWGVGPRALPAPLDPTLDGQPDTPPETDARFPLEAPEAQSTHECLSDVIGDHIPINESLISLLLKLHSQLSGRLDSFSLDEPPPSTQEPIGDGPHFIGILLHKLAALDSRCAETIQLVRRTMWPNQRERQAEQRARERREKEERTRRARERQAQVMRDFARKQQQFLSAVRQLEGEDMEWDEEMVARDYDCVICNTTAPAALHDPIGLVVLLQSTSVLGHRRRAGSSEGVLALSESERARLAAHQYSTAAAHHYRLHDDLHQHFDQESWVLSVSVGWEGGVMSQSCGHHVHLRCLRAYLRSLTASQRPPNLNVERGEFLCPLCRQLANSVLPLAPEPIQPPLRPPPQAAYTQLARDVTDMLERDISTPVKSQLSEAMGKAMTDMTAMAGGKLKQRYGSSPAAIFTFVASLVRTNLECELVQRNNTLVVQPTPRYKPREECIVPLMSVAGTHARALVVAGASLGVASTWRSLVPDALDAADEGGGSGAAVPAPTASRPVPLLLRDPTALLLHVLLLAPDETPHLDIQHFTCIVRTMYALTYYQVVNQLCALGRLAPAQHVRAEGRSRGLIEAAQLLLTALAGEHLLDDDATTTSANQQFDINKAEEEVQELILPYLRIVSLIRAHVYGGELPHITSSNEEFPTLLRYLQLADEDGILVASDGLPPNAGVAARAWARQLATAATGGQLAIGRVVRSLHVVWTGPTLLKLPREYDRLFTYYHERVCLQCGAVPKEASVCLLCGTLVCLKQPCCRQHQVAEASQHAMECGGGTGIFLVVTSTYIIVIRGRRACLWGSLYLDDYDEEDRDLKRGKPLYLSEDRAELLQAQWLAHRFDHTKRTWVDIAPDRRRPLRPLTDCVLACSIALLGLAAPAHRRNLNSD